MAPMNKAWSSLRVNEDRFHRRFLELSTIGVVNKTGVHRLALSIEHLRARQWFLDEAEASGLETHIDGAGNHSAVLACGEAKAPTLLLGSHLDTVPRGGRFDGALGVLAALEVLHVIKENNLQLSTHLEAMDFTDEEGTYLGCFGSQALSGTLSTTQLSHSIGALEDFAAGLLRAGMTPESILAARRDPKTLAGYLELHIEQGPRLQSTDCQIGIVTGIVGIERYRITFVGRADHAGTVSMQDRQDAAQGAAAFILAGRRIVMRDFPDCVVNTGMLALEPGAMNVVTERARVGLEFRCAQAHDKATLETALLEQAEVIAQECELRLEIEKVDSIEAVQMSQTVQHAFTTSTERLGLRYHSMPSGAGHDAQVMSRVCQAGMIFVPSIGGVSHSPKESTNWDDCVNGANVLLQTVLSGF